ncbi:hypothetical protein FOQG_08013 [Fusarium oxysporum f. sp. raphani 54005]|uniref:Uncharacterized protein n=4 Tax=Fusarium oxysporum TaxID=5507 RepID=X0D221_FUSOX|nr:hypothetical protein FOZG_10616 [Fusarium oxysporum Fo47]EWZ90709.1 hypothetical protein FOWG_08290 [Fusarium oxysporum f. sp. lycopersici MN25]EXK88702.1 hypothetical protein FOQG_08013 [Fusarium oxysporum f. sp. raphani 54005]EXL75280.1 hypothetical protein FOPG_09774 [Fusarium oxysporum f. sp. conglutinans race 2 54008]EXM19662.1 hypothetical protein FOTG_12315 [Fusarium oxysporum f. sp. vasinfectum 25433]
MASNPTDLPGPLQPVVSFHISATDISPAAPKTQEKNNRQSSRDILGTRQRSYNILSDERRPDHLGIPSSAEQLVIRSAAVDP